MKIAKISHTYILYLPILTVPFVEFFSNLLIRNHEIAQNWQSYSLFYALFQTKCPSFKIYFTFNNINWWFTYWIGQPHAWKYVSIKIGSIIFIAFNFTFYITHTTVFGQKCCRFPNRPPNFLESISKFRIGHRNL